MSVPVQSSSSSSGSNKSNKVTPPSLPEKEEEDDTEEDFQKLRGYKKTADGRLTTFFNNDLDENTKKLIGDIAPKKIIDPSIPIISSSDVVGSVWNSAGTYEEKVLTPFALETLKQLLETSSFKYGQYEVVVTEAVVTGDAQVTMIRGKRKHLCDLSVSMQWQMKLEGEGSVRLAGGKLSVLDVTADGDFEINEVVLEGEGSHRKAAEEVVRSGGDLRKLIARRVQEFCELLKSK